MHTLAIVALTSPLLLWGMAAVSLPIVAHLLNRRVRRRVVFPTVKLLREAAASQSRAFRLRRWMLLLLRCAAVALLAWAFARPMWVDAQAAAAGGSNGEAVVLVLDVSASAAQREGGVSIVTRTATSAERLLDGLEGGRDVADIVYAAAKPRAAYPQPIVNLEALRDELRGLSATQERADISGAIALAASVVQDHAGPRRIVVLSDMQRTNWADSQGVVARGDAETRVEVVAVGEGGAVNSGIARPTVRPSRPIVGQPATVSVDVVNHAGHRRDVRVTAGLDGREVGAKTLALGAGERANAAFDVVLDQEGPHRMVLSVSGDDLDVDDEKYLVIEAGRRAAIAVVADDDPLQPTGAAYFVSRALAPVGDAGDGFEVRRLRSDEVTAEKLAGVESVIVADVGRLAEPAIEALVGYIDGGGGVLVFLGDGPVSANMAEFQRRAADRPLLPFQPLQRREAGRRSPGWYFGEGAWDSTPLRSFDEAAKLALGEVAMTRIYATGEPPAGAHVLLRYGDGTPALASMEFGSGRLILANFTPSPSGGELAKHGAFVALLHGLVDDLRPRHDPRNDAVVGQTLTYTLPGEAGITKSNVSVVGPADRDLRVEVSQGPAGTTTVQTAATARAGFYVLMRDDQPMGLLAVNIDERESDLRRSEPPFAGRVGDDGASRIADGRAGGGRTAAHPLWRWFIVAAAIMMGLELLLLTVWRR